VNILQQYPSKYLRVADIEFLGGSITYTVKTVQMEDMGKGETKPCMYFRETTQALVVNKSNATRLAESLGPETTTWPGKRVTLSLEDVRVRGQNVKSITAYVDGAFLKERRIPTLAEAQVAAQQPLDDLDDEITI